MSHLLTEILSYAITVSAVLAVMRYRRIDVMYRPFLWLLWVGFINEIISTVLIQSGYYNIYNYNVFYLANILLLLMQFQNWQLFRGRKAPHLLMALVVTVYIIDNLWVSGFHNFNSLFLIFSFFLIVLLSINMVNRQIATEKTSLLVHPVFLICCGQIIHFTFAIIGEVFLLYGSSLSLDFQESIFVIMVWTNFLRNIINALAVLWMPSRQTFSLPY